MLGAFGVAHYSVVDDGARSIDNGTNEERGLRRRRDGGVKVGGRTFEDGWRKEKGALFIYV